MTALRTTLLALLITRTYATPVSRALLNIRNVDGVEIPHGEYHYLL